MGFELRVTDRVGKSESVERQTNTLVVWLRTVDLLTIKVWSGFHSKTTPPIALHVCPYLLFPYLN